jgi:hypothetical protein
MEMIYYHIVLVMSLAAGIQTAAALQLHRCNNTVCCRADHSLHALVALLAAQV